MFLIFSVYSVIALTLLKRKIHLFILISKPRQVKEQLTIFRNRNSQTVPINLWNEIRT